jgi:hypothetical protein
MDFTTDYLPSDICAELIAAPSGAGSKIIVALHHSVDRAFSQ